jgi:hypothetical protein
MVVAVTVELAELTGAEALTRPQGRLAETYDELHEGAAAVGAGAAALMAGATPAAPKAAAAATSTTAS